MRLILAAATAAFIPFHASAQSIDIPSGTYTLDQSHASVLWKISHLGFSNYVGLFDRSALDATVELDADDVANSTLSVTVNGQEVRTLHPGEKDFNSEIEAQFINTVENPEITFTTTSIEVTGENTANIAGDLTFNAITLPLVLDTTLNLAAPNPFNGTPTFGVSAVGTIDRTAFDAGRFAPNIGANVAVEIEAEFTLVE